jgi:endonuclease YncB( thermonuclease family)
MDATDRARFTDHLKAPALFLVCLVSVILILVIVFGPQDKPNQQITPSPVSASMPPDTPEFDPHPAHKATVIRIHDGDTALFRINLEAGVSVDAWVRFESFNAPELSGPNKQKATQATKTLSDLLDKGQVWVKLTGNVSFNRHVGRVYSVNQDGAIDLSTKMTELGYDVPQGQ